MQNIIITFIAFFVLRLLSLSYSIRNEKRLLKSGAVQYGKVNSLLLTLAHIVYYFRPSMKHTLRELPSTTSLFVVFL